ncbi:hypothetical protein [Thermobrachium celere]|uniref:Family 2 glycosyl transferase n=1 Tax=Thermobrachium celere DSM 8682 TaxID=941824 RepID=R7RUU1_9CLOT|nr:hypothetical protein [Thermobrachium celere]CDF59253.1 hypothetical protein TCEL_02321 [Thermobrachium celere DSM 8682]
MNIKRYFVFIILILALIYPMNRVIKYKKNMDLIFKDGNVKYISKVDDKYFYIYEDKQFKKIFIKGVNIGASKPGYFPGEFGITKEDYLRWFKYIQDMNANTIRVYTRLMPEFYEALYEYNKKADKPLYVFHGVWINEEDILKYKDAHNPKIKEAAVDEVKKIIDIIHGNISIEKEKGHAFGNYTKDISKYVIGWILGIEWDPEFVVETNNKNKDKTSYDGKYLYTKDASPFEVFLCEFLDEAIKYETEKYGMQRPTALSNWVTTDMLEHPNEPLEKEDMVSVNPEHIKKKDTFKPGLFASYHIYPYYPDFMSYDKRYSSYIDENGKVNPYRAYLKDLRKEHTMPVLVAEFGIPSSRGMAHVNIHTGFNQGFVEEKKQGEYLVSMLEDIYREGYAGGLVFTWQDEWFKRTWNTMDLDLPDRRPYWKNVQTNEQMFGLLTFEPGEVKSVCYVDGDESEWNNDPLIQEKNINLSVNYDEGYVYFKLKVKDFNIDKDTLYISIDIKENQGNTKFIDEGLIFERPVDFVIKIRGKEDSRIMVDAYYDHFYYEYSKRLKMDKENTSYEIKDSGIFNNIYLCLNRPFILPEDKIELPLQKYETGKLMFGVSNPNREDFNSLADYYIKGDVVEIRIPWQLLNVMDPSTKMIMDDLYLNNGIKPIKTEGFYVGAILKKHDEVIYTSMKQYIWNSWDMPKYHERLKKSYYILKEAFKSIGGE